MKLVVAVSPVLFSLLLLFSPLDFDARASMIQSKYSLTKGKNAGRSLSNNQSHGQWHESKLL
jgi:hypothetical protein